MRSPREVVDRMGGHFPLPDDAFDRLTLRRDRRHRNKRIATAALALAISLAAAGAFARAVMLEETPADGTLPPAPTPTEVPAPTPSAGIDWDAVPGVSVDGDALVDIGTGEVTPLAPSIASVRDLWVYGGAPGGVVLFGGDAEGSKEDQLFIANVDGTNVRQLTDAPGGAFDGAWSPDGTKIAAVLWSGGGAGNPELVVIEVATGETTPLATGNLGLPRFSSDGQLVFFVEFADREGAPSEMFGVPVDGGDAALVHRRVPWNTTLSPDGQMITYTEWVTIDTTGGQEVWVADADGDQARLLVPGDEPFGDNPSWSPDGAQIVFTKWRRGADELAAVVDVATGSPTFAVRASEPSVGVWVDDHTLLVDVGAF